MVNNVLLSKDDYTLSNALLWGNCTHHFQRLSEDSFCNGRTIVDLTLFLLELPPIIGQIVSLFETFIAFSLLRDGDSSELDDQNQTNYKEKISPDRVRLHELYNSIKSEENILDDLNLTIAENEGLAEVNDSSKGEKEVDFVEIKTISKESGLNSSCFSLDGGNEPNPPGNCLTKNSKSHHYQIVATENQRNIIEELITALNEKNVGYLWFWKNYYQRLVEQVQHLSPFCYLAFIFNDSNLVNHMKGIFDQREDRFAKEKWARGIMILNLMFDRELLDPENFIHNLIGFANFLEVESEVLEHLAEEANWEGFVAYLLSKKIPLIDLRKV